MRINKTRKSQCLLLELFPTPQQQLGYRSHDQEEGLRMEQPAWTPKERSAQHGNGMYDITQKIFQKKEKDWSRQQHFNVLCNCLHYKDTLGQKLGLFCCLQQSFFFWLLSSLPLLRTHSVQLERTILLLENQPFYITSFQYSVGLKLHVTHNLFPYLELSYVALCLTFFLRL